MRAVEFDVGGSALSTLLLVRCCCSRADPAFTSSAAHSSYHTELPFPGFNHHCNAATKFLSTLLQSRPWFLPRAAASTQSLPHIALPHHFPVSITIAMLPQNLDHKIPVSSNATAISTLGATTHGTCPYIIATEHFPDSTTAFQKCPPPQIILQSTLSLRAL